MLFDDGLEADEDAMTAKSKEAVTMTDLSEALSEKYEKLKSKLLWEMAKMSAGNDFTIMFTTVDFAFQTFSLNMFFF